MAKWISVEDKQRQEAVLAKILKHFNNLIVHDGDSIEGTKTDTSAIDYYVAKRNDPDKLYPIEVRCRTCNHDTYSTVFMNLSKWRTGREIAEKNGTEFLFFVQWEDGLYWINECRGTMDVDRRVEINGRNQMRDDNDVKTEVVLIPICQFTRMCD